MLRFCIFLIFFQESFCHLVSFSFFLLLLLLLVELININALIKTRQFDGTSAIRIIALLLGTRLRPRLMYAPCALDVRYSSKAPG